MNIGQAALASGLSSKAIRYYEDLGLVVPGRDQNNDYRVYSDEDVRQLRFLQRSRAIGLSLDEAKELLALYIDEGRRCAQVRVLVMDRIGRVDQHLSELTALRETLSQIADECVHKSDAPDIVSRGEHKPVAMAFTLLDDSSAR